MTPHEAYNRARNTQNPTPQTEHIIAQNPEYACLYALCYLCRRFHQAEPIIATDPYWAYYYARNVIQNRFPKAEPTIAQDQHYAYWYLETIMSIQHANYHLHHK